MVAPHLPEDSPRPPAAASVWVEALLALAILAGIGHALYFLNENGYLPQPFLYDIADPLMDLYWTAYWSHQQGAYAVWNSIYPPLSFVFLRFFSTASCYGVDAFVARDCDIGLRVIVVCGFMAINFLVLLRAYRHLGARLALARAVAVGFGFPALFAADRGNLIIPCFTFYCLAFSMLIQRQHLRAASLALAINFKPYLLVTLFAALAQRRFRWLMQVVCWGLVIYGVTFSLQGGGSPQELLYNLTAFGQETSVNYWERIYASTSFAPFLRLMDSDFSLLPYIDSALMDRLAWAGVLLMRAGQLGSLLVLLGCWLRPSVHVDERRVVAMMVALLLSMSESGGGYALLFVLFLVFFEPWKGWLSGAILVCAYLLCIPGDFILIPIFQHTMDAYWSNQTVYAEFGISIAQFLRPLLLLLILYGLIGLNIAQLVRRKSVSAKPFRTSIPLVH